MINSLKLTTLVALSFSAAAGIADEYITADCGGTNGNRYNQGVGGPVGLYRASYNQNVYNPNAYNAARPNNYGYNHNSAQHNLNNNYQRTGYGPAWPARDSAFNQRTSAGASVNYNRGYAQPGYRPTPTLGNLFGLFSGPNYSSYNNRGIAANNGYSYRGSSNPAGYYGR